MKRLHDGHCTSTVLCVKIHYEICCIKSCQDPLRRLIKTPLPPLKYYCRPTAVPYTRYEVIRVTLFVSAVDRILNLEPYPKPYGIADQQTNLYHFPN